jgi:hypothetical protein
MSRALVISCQYASFHKNQLFGCFNDSDAFISRLKKIDPLMKITLMRDDLNATHPLFPNVQNIGRELLNLSKCSETKLYFHYSGHGTTTPDINKDERTYLQTTNGNQISILNGANGDSCMVCYHGKKLVLLRDDDFYYYLSFLRANQTLMAFSDSCNSGTLFDLCYLNVGNYTGTFTPTDISGLLLQIDNKCSCIKSYYPDKVNKARANILLISGTRDKDYSYEVSIDKKACGLFTFNLCKLLDYGVKDMSLKTFYYLLIACINWNNQIPVLTFSQNLNMDNYKMTMFEYKPEKNTPKPIMNVSVVGRAMIIAQSNNRKYY